MKRQAPSLAWIGLLLGISWWIMESAIHTYVFGGGPLLETLQCEHDPNEIWMRILITVLLTAFGFAAERLVRAERHEKDSQPGIAAVLLEVSHAAKKKSGRHQEPGARQANRRQTSRSRVPRWQKRQTGGKRNMNQRKQRSMGVGQGPHQPARGIRHVQVQANLEAVQSFQHHAESEKDKQRPPTDPQVPPSYEREIFLRR